MVYIYYSIPPDFGVIAPVPILTILVEPEKTNRFRYLSEFQKEGHGYFYSEDHKNKKPISVKVKHSSS